MKRYSVTIIGMGPRGLSVLERIAAIAGSRQLLLDIILIEPGECGPGVHAARQPQHLLINTLASQVTMFPAAGAVQHAPVCATPSLTAWARQQGYRRVGERYYPLGDAGAGAGIGDADYLPRSLLGAYLAWVYQQIAAALPACVSLTHHRLRACDLWQQPDGRSAIELDSGYIVLSDFVFLTTGHGASLPGDLDAWLAKFAQDHARYNSRLAFVRQVYPLDQLVRIGADARVAIQGLGLSAHDVLAELTVGRGGAFVRLEDGRGGLRYQRSGREPRLTLCSRNCLPYAARGINQKGLDGRHQPHYFTPDAVDALRRQALATRGSRQLDFDRELLPLLKREMAYVYRRAQDPAMPDDPAAFQLGAGDAALIDALLFPLQDQQFATLEAFRQFFTGWLAADLAQARLGNVASPVKAATDVLRDVRATLQAAIEHGGLTPASHRKFLNVYHPAINRAAFGPPLRRNEELLALLDAGVVELLSGPGCTVDIDENDSTYVLTTKFAGGVEKRPVDALVIARLDGFFPETETSLLIRNVLKRGLARPYYNGVFHPGGIDIDHASQPLNTQGEPSRNIWALGYPVEGAHYYTHALPRPQMRSRQVLDADRCVIAMFAQMADYPHPGAHRRPAAAVQSHATL
ncbi:FAD/NAD(P)-binding protein [Duganella sp. CT11-25]|uniref:FAD/NAD(P)-binding protein n=1 Tax=unclassified Duganella TaxID=2636909 RepID=UPI0039B04CBA